MVLKALLVQLIQCPACVLYACQFFVNYLCYLLLLTVNLLSLFSDLCKLLMLLTSFDGKSFIVVH